MKQEFHNIDKIEQYLNGSLSGQELEAFNQAISQDPMLANEVELQKTIQDSISHQRMADLKYRLNNITVSTIDPFRSVKVAAGVITGALLTGLLGYEVAEMTKPSPQLKTTEPTLEIVEEDKQIVVEEHDESLVYEESSSTTSEKIEEETTQEITATNTTETESVVIQEKTPTVKPNFPGVEESFIPEDDSEPKFSTSEEIPSNDLNSNVDTKVAGDIIVEFESGKGNLEYKFEGPKVYLYGINKSGKKPVFYDVYMSGTKKTYMKYEGDFYKLDRTATKKTTLVEEKDATIIRELKSRYKD